jgi:hypothetical protein
MKRTYGKTFFQVREASIEAIGSKLDMRIFDEYANILRCMYSTRFSGGSSGTGSSPEDQPIPKTSTLPSLDPWNPDDLINSEDG